MYTVKIRKKLGVYLATANFVGLITGIILALVSGILAGLTGFLIGILGSTAIMYLKEQK